MATMHHMVNILVSFLQLFVTSFLFNSFTYLSHCRCGTADSSTSTAAKHLNHFADSSHDYFSKQGGSSTDDIIRSSLAQVQGMVVMSMMLHDSISVILQHSCECKPLPQLLKAKVLYDNTCEIIEFSW